MRKCIALVLAVLILTGCSATSLTDVKNAPMELQPPVLAAEIAQPEEITFDVELSQWSDTVAADDGTELVHYAFAVPVMRARRKDGTKIVNPVGEVEKQAVEAVDVFNQSFETWAEWEEIDAISSQAEEDFNWRTEEGYAWTAPYVVELTCSVYQTEFLVSVDAEYYSNTGGAHPNTWMISWNFDLSTGAFFTPELLATDVHTFSKAVQEELVRQAQTVANENGIEPEKFFWEDYQEILEDWSSYAVSFHETGMTVAFSPYELASYAAGPQEFIFSYAWLLPYLSNHGKEVLGLSVAEESE